MFDTKIMILTESFEKPRKSRNRKIFIETDSSRFTRVPFMKKRVLMF